MEKKESARPTCINRAAKLTVSPSTVYSRRCFVPTVPQNASPGISCEFQVTVMQFNHGELNAERNNNDLVITKMESITARNQS